MQLKSIRFNFRRKQSMSIEKLKELLASGAITQQEFDELSKNVKDTEATPEQTVETTQTEPLDMDKIDKLLQSRLDKAMAKERKEKADLQKRLERLQQSKLTDDEIKQVELEEKERTIAEREKAIAEKENRLYAVKAIKEAGLDDGSDVALSLVDFVMGEDETEINAKIKCFKKLFDRAIAAEIDKRFKEGGYTPQKGGSLNGGKNPFSTEQWNLTEQYQLMANNPDLAKQLQAAVK